MRSILLILLFLVQLSASFLFSQNKDSSSVQLGTKLVLPLVFFSPETNLGFGAAGFLGFTFPGEKMIGRASNIQLGGAYTLNKQLLLYTSYQLFWKDNDWQSYGELGYYRYSYFFYGIGNQASNRGEELYDVNFPRLRLHLLRRLTGKLYGGVQLWMDDQNLVQVKEGGLLDAGPEEIQGSRGGRSLAHGLMLVYDSRDQVNYAAEGMLASLESRVSLPALGSEFEYWRSVFDLRYYKRLPWNHILAANLYLENIEGDPPFFAMAAIGGNKRMRGYYEGFYRDKKYATLQFSYRADLFWRFKLHLFGGVGQVGAAWNEFESSNWRYTYGSGLRFLLNEKDQVHLRIDAAFGKNTSGFYLTVGEAF